MLVTGRKKRAYDTAGKMYRFVALKDEFLVLNKPANKQATHVNATEKDNEIIKNSGGTNKERKEASCRTCAKLQAHSETAHVSSRSFFDRTCIILKEKAVSHFLR